MLLSPTRPRDRDARPQRGSVSGHGGYVAPDWDADGLHREATTLLEYWARAKAMATVGLHYQTLFSSDPSLHALRVQYAIPEKSITNPEYRRQLPVPDRRNWLAVMVSGAARRGEEAHATVPARDPFLSMKPTPSMKATTKYFILVIALFLAQVLLGAITAHYAVEGQEFYGYNISEIIPYALTRNWLSKQGFETGLPGQPDRFDTLSLASLAIALIGWVAAPDQSAMAALLLFAAVMHAVRLARWSGYRTWRDPFVVILHISYAWLPLGLVLLGASIF